MLDYDADVRSQLARERAEELARDYRRSQRRARQDDVSMRKAGLALLVGRLRRRRLARAAAYRG